MADPSKISGKVYQSGGTTSQFEIKGLGNEKYWVKVGRFGADKGKIELWNEERLQLDSRIGVINPDGTINFNEGPGGVGLRKVNGKWVDERDIIREQVNAIREQAKNTVIEDAQRDNQVDSPAEAIKEADDVFSGQNNETARASNLASQGMLKQWMGGNIEDRAGTNNDFPTLVYPQTLQADKQDIIRFEVMKYAPSKMKQGDSKLGGFEEVGRGGGGLGGGWKDRTPIGSVTFPIPGGIREDNSVDWGDATMNPIEATFAKIALDFLTSNDAVGTVGDVGNAVKKRQREIGGGLSLAIAQAAVGGTGRLMTRETGAVLNPNMQLLFKQPQLRPFTFTFQLTPREKEEADTVMQIIRLFKQAMAPIRSDSMLFLKSPHTFKLTYLHKTKDHPYIGSIKECALMTCGVDYTADQNYMTYEDGVMTSYSLALQFKELEPVYNDDYGTSNAKDLNFSGAIKDGQSTFEGTSDYAVDSGVSPGYGINDDKGISPLTGQPIDTSKGGSYI